MEMFGFMVLFVAEGDEDVEGGVSCGVGRMRVVEGGAAADDCCGNEGDGLFEYSDPGVPGVGGALPTFDEL